MSERLEALRAELLEQLGDRDDWVEVVTSEYVGWAKRDGESVLLDTQRNRRHHDIVDGALQLVDVSPVVQHRATAPYPVCWCGHRFDHHADPSLQGVGCYRCPCTTWEAPR